MTAGSLIDVGTVNEREILNYLLGFVMSISTFEEQRVRLSWGHLLLMRLAYERNCR